MARAVNLVSLAQQKSPPRREKITFINHDSGMNKTETEYSVFLGDLMRAGKIKRWRYEAVRLEFARRTTYTPDFMVTATDGSVEFHEVKGSWQAPHQEDARVKLKVAAEMYPEFRFVCAVRVPQKKGGGWNIERFVR